MYEMAHWKGAVKAPGFLVESRAQAQATSPNWSGYVASDNNGIYHAAEAWYNEPEFYPGTCSTTAEVTWAGIGGWQDTGLGQVGTTFNVPGFAAHQAFWEVWPDVNMMPIKGFIANINYKIDAAVVWLNPGYSFYVYNYYNGTSASYTTKINDYSGNSAEAIAERPTIDKSYSDLSNFGTLKFDQSQANGYPMNSNNVLGSLLAVIMQVGSNPVMADPSSMGSGGSFSVTQHHCDPNS